MKNKKIIVPILLILVLMFAVSVTTHAGKGNNFLDALKEEASKIENSRGDNEPSTVDNVAAYPEAETQTIAADTEKPAAVNVPSVELDDSFIIKENPDSGYAAILSDKSSLLSKSEEEEVLNRMQTITPDATAIFVTSDREHGGNIVEFAKLVLEDICSKTNKDGYNAVIFLIDMYYRELVIYAGETTGHVISTALANSMTDNVYRYASEGDYAKCADKAFEQIYRLLDGQRIAQPMRYITAALLSIFIGLGFALILVRSKTKKSTAANENMIYALLVRKFSPKIKATVTNVKKTPHVEVHYSSGSNFGSSYHSSGSSSYRSSGGSSYHSSGGSSYHSSGGSSRSSGSSGHGHGGSHRF